MEFWFEFGSTYSYPAALRIEALAQERGVSVAWRSFLLGPIFRSQGWNDSPFNIYPAKGRYMWRDLERICDAHDIPFRRPTHFPRNGLLAARVACAHADAAWLPDFVRAVYRANFEHDLEISEPSVLTACLEAAGADAAAALAEAHTDAARARLREQTRRAEGLGVFGAPSFSIGEELFWGHDRLDEALTWAVTHAT